MKAENERFPRWLGRVPHIRRSSGKKRFRWFVPAGQPAGDVDQVLGCSPQAVNNWVRRYERDQGIAKDGLTTEEREELKKLRRENLRLKQERDLPERAAAFFAADQ